MREFFILFVCLLVTIVRLMKPGGAKAIVAENLLMKQQLLAACRARRRAPRLSVLDRLLFGWWSLFLNRRRDRAAILLKSSTLLRFHATLVERKYHRLYTPRTRTKPGPEGPFKELIHAIVEMKRRNPGFGCPRIAQQIVYTFGVELRALCRMFNQAISKQGIPNSCITRQPTARGLARQSYFIDPFPLAAMLSRTLSVADCSMNNNSARTPPAHFVS